jgi:hypothetical protein
MITKRKQKKREKVRGKREKKAKLCVSIWRCDVRFIGDCLVITERGLSQDQVETIK